MDKEKLSEKELNNNEIEKVSGGVNRDMEVSPSQSDIGTVADENALPSEVNSRSGKTWIFDIGVTTPAGGGGQHQRKS